MTYTAVLDVRDGAVFFLARAVSCRRDLRGSAALMSAGWEIMDIGTGLPSANNTHQVAQAAAPASRVVYVDNDHCKSGCAHAC